MAEHSANIGKRLRELRRWRGLTLAELGGLAGVTPSQVSMWETGRRPLDRRSHISALAAALKVSETELTGGPHLGTDSEQSAPHAVIPALRLALQTNTLTIPGAERARSPVSGLAVQVAGQVRTLRRACDYAAIGHTLPAMLDDLHFHVARPRDEADARLALETLVEACSAASAIARNLGYPDLAFLAATRAEEAAAALGDPFLKGKADFMWVWALPRGGSWDRPLAAAERVADELEPHAREPRHIEVLGMLTLNAALAAASARKSDLAGHWLAEADKLAKRVPDDLDHNWQSFGKTNVDVWRLAVDVERGETGYAVRKMAARVPVAKLTPSPERMGGFFLNVGCGLARAPQTRNEAIRWLLRAEKATPQRARNSPRMRETVIYLRDRELASAARELRGMAARMGIPG